MLLSLQRVVIRSGLAQMCEHSAIAAETWAQVCYFL